MHASPHPEGRVVGAFALVSTVLLPLSLTLTGGCANAPAPKSWAEVPEVAQYERHWPQSRHLAPGPAPQEEWVEIEGASIHLDRHVGAPDRDITVLLLHGGGGHGRLLLPFARPLHAAGYEVVAPDLPAYGLSTGSDLPLTFDLWVRIASALVDREHARGRKVVVYGLSIGGITAYHVAAENPRVAAVVATTLIDMRQPEVRDAAARNRFVSRVLYPIAAATPKTSDRIRMKARAIAKLSDMSPDRDIVRALSRDPRIGQVKMPMGFFRTLSERAPAREPEAFDGPPVLLVHPGEDTWTPLPLSEAFFERIAGPKRLVRLDRAAHLPFEQPGYDQLQDAVLAFVSDLESG